MGIEADASEPEADILEAIPFSRIVKILKRGPLLQTTVTDSVAKGEVSDPLSGSERARKRVSFFGSDMGNES